MKPMTRQQLRKQQRTRNKELRTGQASLKRYRLNSKYPAVMMNVFTFKKDTTLHAFIQTAHEAAEGIQDTYEPKWVLLVRETPDTQLPAEKREIMKICTRIFKKHAPRRPFLFLDITQAEFENDVYRERIWEFLEKFSEVPEDAEFPDWMHEYIYREKGKNIE